MSKLEAKKSLGQHFLRSEKALNQIIENLDKDFNKENFVFEIGPGEGVLTEKLLQNGYKVCVIELDERSVEMISEDFREYIESGKLRIIHKNCLDISYDEEIKKLGQKSHEYLLIGNIPYYITGLIFRHTFEQKVLPKQAIFLVQKEVADRVVARDKKESILSVSVKVFGEAKYVDTVYAGSFAPPPKVDSAILAVNKIQNLFKVINKQDVFFKILKAAFSQKRKMMFSNLKKNLEKNIIEKYSETINNIFKEKYGEKVRAEDVEIADWVLLAKEI
jgi:16S rRNA (adenine1518-N6/adenine1519-N6)-dimethyltransferase